MRAECKAHQVKIGGDDISKFRGVLKAEQIEEGKTKLTGYFVSLSGFRGSVIEQERRLGKKGLSLVDAPRIIEVLEKGNFLISDAEATDQAGRCVNRMGLHELVVDGIELLGHEMGYVKAVYYAHNMQRTHVALIHADGTALAAAPAQKIMLADQASGGSLYQLQYLAPAALSPDMQAQEQNALASYYAWLKRECGFIQLDGLPLDGEFNKSLELEKLFVPLRVTHFPHKTRDTNASYSHQESGEDDGLYTIGERLATKKHLAVLASPGSGKSTLLKRLATAYAFPHKREAIEDELPNEDWLPLLLRCRTVRGRTHKSILKLLERLPKQLNMPGKEVDGFRRVLRTALHNGKVLLLVDGLDEIWEESERKEFAYNLRTFIGAYPQVHMVVTSREAGFRLVGGIIADFCQQTWLAPLEIEDIMSLCEHWHVQVYGDSPDTRVEIDKTIEAIIENNSIKALAENPLLLTTLLVVKRSVGEMPTNRAALYAATVQMLVRTWNIEGFNALNERETFAQLCYVACAMMESGEEQISKSHLLELLQDARRVLAAELHNTKLSPEDFLIQVEHRSSLLMMTGHAQVQGELEPVYEFRHLTFQEFLAARGYVRRLHARRKDGLSLTQLLKPHFAKSSWQEVIALAAVLAEVDAEPLVECLIDLCEQIPADSADLFMEDYQRAHVLGQCVLDEVTIDPAIMRSALKQLARLSDDDDLVQMLHAIRQGPTGPVLEEVALKGFLGEEPGWEEFSEVLREFYHEDLRVKLGNQSEQPEHYFAFLDEAIEMLGAGDRLTRIQTAFNVASVIRGWYHSGAPTRPHGIGRIGERAEHLQSRLVDMITSHDKPSVFAASWALALWYRDEAILAAPPTTSAILKKILLAWYQADSPHLARTVAWAFANQPLLEKDILKDIDFADADFGAFLTGRTHLFDNANSTSNQARAVAIAAWYLATWSETQVAFAITQAYATAERTGLRINKWQQKHLDKSTTMLVALGQAGEEALAKRALRISTKKKATHWSIK
jgi:hypothetical protein